jgi:signal recognition particle GTPase
LTFFREVEPQHADVTGLTISKRDGSAKGGFVLAAHERAGIPIKRVGQGEGIGDLTGFTPHVFVQNLMGQTPFGAPTDRPTSSAALRLSKRGVDQ